MTEVVALNRDTAKQRPESVFERPLAIVDQALFTKGEKLTALARWRRNILDELVASGEGMATRGHAYGQLAVLEEIEEAKARLNKHQQPEMQN